MDELDHEYVSKLLEKGSFSQLESYLKKFPNNSETLTIKGNIELLKQNYPTAIEFLEKAAHQSKDNEVIWNNLGLAYYNMGELSKALKMLDKALEIKPNYIDAMINVGTCYLANNQLKEAQKSFEAALKLAPENAGVWSNLGLIYLNQQKFGDAKVCFLRSINLEPSENAYYNLALVEKFRGELEDSKEHFQKVLDINSQNIAAELTLSEVFYLLKDDQAARIHLQSVLSQNLTKELEVAAQLLKGKLTCITNNDAAYEAFERAIELDHHLDNFLDYVECLKRINLEKAIMICEKGLEYHPENDALLHEMAIAKIKLYEGTFKTSLLTEAIEHFKHIYNNDSTNSRAVFNIGACYQRIGDFKKANKWFDKAIELDSSLKERLEPNEAS